jgi:signal transduction histidine kinase
VSEKKNVLMISPADPAHYSYTDFPSSGDRDLIHRIYADEMNNIWAGDESGNVFCRASGTKNFQWRGNINHAGKVRTNYPVYCFYFDPSGRLWTGSYMLGLVKAEIQRKGFNVFPRTGSGLVPENIFVNTFFEQGEEVWLGTFQKGIVILDRTTGDTRTLDLPYSGPPLVYGKSVHLIRSDSRGNLWTGSSGYMYVRRKGEDRFTPVFIPPVPSALQNTQVWSLAEYDDGWLVGTNVGVYRLTEQRGRFRMEHIAALGKSRVTGLWRAPAGEWYIAFESGGVMITKDPLTNSPHHSIFDDINIKALSYDEVHAVLWICSSDGLIAWHPSTGNHRLFSAKEGLTNSYTYAVLPDSDNLWISTNSGLVRATLDYTSDDVLPAASFATFTMRDGLPDNQFNANAAHKGASGVLYFGTPSGIVWFSPRDVRPNTSVPKIVMTDIAVNGERVSSAGYLSRMSLPWSQNNLFFRFRGIEYNNPAKVHYSYQLKGWSDDWVDNGTSNEVRYNNLPPGHYTFSVRTANSSGTWGNETYSVAIAITPPFWRTGWFYAAVVIVCVAAIVMITRRISFLSFQRKLAELERQREIDRERQRISREMHDDIGAGLTRITLISEFARNKGTAGVSTELEEIAGTSRQLVSNMGEIIWSLNPENGTLGQLFAYLREQLHRQLEYSGIEYTISFPDEDSGLILSNEARRNIMLASREIVNNAIRHSRATSIRISASISGSTLTFEISDNGTGFETGRIYSGNGLNNIRQRIAALRGELSIVSSPRTGTRFVFVVRQ